MENWLKDKTSQAISKDSDDSTVTACSAAIIITFFGTLIIGVFAALFSIISLFGKCRTMAIILSALTSILGLIGLICTSIIINKFQGTLIMGCATILTFVFALIAAGLLIANKVISSKKRA